MSENVLEAEGIYKEYRLGMIGGGTLHDDLSSWFARVRGKEDPRSKIGAKQFTGRERFMALSDINLQVATGDALGILGRNGAGKSTLLKLISRITAPTKGEIRIKGRVASLLEIGTGFHRELSGRDNIFLNGAILGMSRAETASKLDEIIEFSEISQFIDTPVKRYSSGMYVKLAFAVAAHLDPDILICDEVLAVGDVAFQQKCLSKMADVAHGGRAVLYVSHNMRTISELCSRAVYLDDGKLAYDGEVARAIDLYAGSGNRSVDRDLDSLRRSRMQGVSIRMLSMHIFGSECMEYAMDDAMEFSVTSRTDIDMSRLRLRLILKSHNAQPIAMSQTKPIDVRAGETFTMHVRQPLRGIAPGEYGISLALVAGEVGYRGVGYDTLVDVGHFIITDDPKLTQGFKWYEPAWGNVRLDDLELL